MLLVLLLMLLLMLLVLVLLLLVVAILGALQELRMLGTGRSGSVFAMMDSILKTRSFGRFSGSCNELLLSLVP